MHPQPPIRNRSPRLRLAARATGGAGVIRRTRKVTPMAAPWLVNVGALLRLPSRLRIWREAFHQEVFGLRRALLHAARFAPVASVLDVGASDGSWSAECMHAYPDAWYHLIEAQESAHGSALSDFCRAHPRTSCVFAAAGPHPGTAYFDATDPFGGLASSDPCAGEAILTLPMTTLDAEVHAKSLRPPYLVKLDTHGYEFPILDGAAATLAQANVVVVEMYNFDIAPDCVRFPGMIQRLEDAGFLPFDLVQIRRRPADHCLWQFDLVCLRKTAACFQGNTYRPSV